MSGGIELSIFEYSKSEHGLTGTGLHHSEIQLLCDVIDELSILVVRYRMHECSQLAIRHNGNMPSFCN